jgi:hypothetical protein
MLSLTLLPLLLVTASFALPSSRGARNIKVPYYALPLPDNQTQLVLPIHAPSFVTVAVGSQNYSCSSDGTWVWVVIAALSFVHSD